MNYNGVDIQQLKDGFILEHNGFVIYLDPAELNGDSKKADVVLLTDGNKPCSKEQISDILTDDTLLLATPTIGDEEYSELAAADFINQKGIEIRGVPGYAKDMSMSVGFLITMNGTKLYHPGGTEILPNVVDLKSESIDVALLPDTEKRMASLMKEVMPKTVVPTNGSTSKLKKLLPNFKFL
jgi:hypothetical protein